MPHIPEDIKNQIIEKATLENVLNAYHGPLKKKGSQFVANCPKCGEKDKLEFSRSKNVAKCFKCDIGVKTPVNYLTKFHDMDFVQALEELAKIENVSLKELPAPKVTAATSRTYQCQTCNKRTDQYKQTKIPAKEGDVDFDWVCKVCDTPTVLVSHKAESRKKRQAEHQVPYLQVLLDGSGLSTADVTGPVYIDEDTREERSSYESGTVDGAFEIVPGDDVIIHYYDLEGRQMTYYKKDRKGNATGKPRPFYRVRYQNPELHKDKRGNPVKYRSPYGSDTKVYLNKWIREKYKKSSKIETLYIQEGEKKADKATKHGLISVGVMGIHNIAYNKRLPIEFESIIKRCQVENVVFVLDEDWDHLGRRIDSEHSADQRPKSFFRAVVNFKNHFYAFTANDIHLNIFFGHVKTNPEKDKGIDDLLVNSLRGGKEDGLKDLCKEALVKPDGDAKWIQFYKITTMSEYKLQEFWHLTGIDDFTNHYKPRLKDLKKFRYGSVEYRFNEKGHRELAQPLMPDEEFYEPIKKKNDEGETVIRGYNFDYKNCYVFLRNRGFHRLSQPNNSFYWIQIKGNIVRRVEPFQIKDFVSKFAASLNNKRIENMLFKGGQMYLGPQSLGNMYFTDLALHQASKNMQYIYFNKKYFKITDEGYELADIKDLNGQVWQDSILDFEPSITEPLLSEVHPITDEDIKNNSELEKYKGEFALDFSESGQKCDFLMFLLNTSIFFGKDKSFEQATYEEKFETTRHLMSKLTAFGYMLHRFRESDNQKAVVAMDGTMSELGKSNGRSGKSVLGIALEQLVPTVTINGKRKDLLDDKYLFSDVDQRTGAIFFDDVRSNFDIETIFPHITGKFTLERKGQDKMTMPAEFVQKFYITTNHALRGEGGSFEDRQFLLGFSNWYNVNHKPKDDFGCMFFDEWDTPQWNLFYNLAATCLHLFFKYGLVTAPSDKLKARKMRQEMGEQFLDWAEEYFSNVNNVNTRIYKDTMYQCMRSDSDHMAHGDGFVVKYPTQRRWTTIQHFKSKIRLYCKFKGYDYNPTKEGDDIKSNGREYMEVFVPEELYAELLKNGPVTHNNGDDDMPI